MFKQIKNHGLIMTILKTIYLAGIVEIDKKRQALADSGPMSRIIRSKYQDKPLFFMVERMISFIVEMPASL